MLLWLSCGIGTTFEVWMDVDYVAEKRWHRQHGAKSAAL